VRTALQILAAAVGLAVIGGVLGLIVGQFVGSGDAANGVGWGMVGVGAIVGFAAGGSGSPSENLVRGRSGAFGTYWGESAPLPQSPLQVALGGCLTFVVGVGVLFLTHR
jgi:hypothetical protein